MLNFCMVSGTKTSIFVPNFVRDFVDDDDIVVVATPAAVVVVVVVIATYTSLLPSNLHIASM